MEGCSCTEFLGRKIDICFDIEYLSSAALLNNLLRKVPGKYSTVRPRMVCAIIRHHSAYSLDELATGAEGLMARG